MTSQNPPLAATIEFITYQLQSNFYNSNSVAGSVQVKLNLE